MTSRSPRKRPITPSSTLRSTLIRSCSAGLVLASLAVTTGRAGDSVSKGDPLQRLKDRSGSIRWNEIRDRSAASNEAAPKDIRIEVPMPALEKPGLPPITKTIFDQIDSPFGDPEDLSTDAANLAFESDQAAPADDLEDSAPLPMPAFLAPPQPNPFPVSEPTETFLGEEAVVGPAVPFSVAVDVEKGEPSDLPEQAPDPIPPGDKGDSASARPPEKENLLDHPELRPLNEIRPYYDYFPDGSELHSAGPAATKVPVEQPLPEEGSLDRAFGGTSFMWAASNLYHNPLYFEDPELERYGHDHGFLQPAASIAKFGVQLVGMPYQLALDPPASRVYALGWYRPQEICTPKKKSRIPFNAKAAATAAGAYTGLIFIFP